MARKAFSVFTMFRTTGVPRRSETWVSLMGTGQRPTTIGKR